ncbi:LPS assembly lipoprotein LptE [Tropicimonas sediminicola]|uniref:LPS-assembly lipoprotein n=1 Tax=Tropicimonas sediminicola TaxID=1031541 RepID=A0A239JIF4_9RHOB|nr:LPS assembly lipoprotein LptE [Tropicimonas sediminicola]SNT05617.1 LPS-assembly lipoprotein [Tropicimonas sediminicola]
MWSPDRRALLAALAVTGGLAACGFTPAYAPGGSAYALRNQILAEAPSSTEEYAFVVQFEDRLGRTSDAAPYLLTYSITTETDGLAVTSDQETLRYNLSGEVRFTVTDRASGAVLTSGRTESFTSYSAIGTTVATRASEKSASERLMVILADQTVSQLLATAGSWQP